MLGCLGGHRCADYIDIGADSENRLGFRGEPILEHKCHNNPSKKKKMMMARATMLMRTPFILGEFFPRKQQNPLILRRRIRSLSSRATLDADADAAAGAGQSKRLVDVARRLPRIAQSYFRSPFRRALFGGIALLGGFYVAQTISLSFGALGVNDVIAAAMCVLFTEFVTRFTRTRKNLSFSVALVNNFKMGFTYGLFIDAFKLAS